MRVLLDTHAFLWWIEDNTRLSGRARETIADESNDILFSVVSAWEIVIKAGIGRLELPGSPEEFIPEQLARNDLEILPVSLNHALRSYSLPDHHRDPFDRLLVAQSAVEGVPILSSSPEVSRYPVEVVW